MTVPFAFANLSGNIALAKLDSNFNTPITIGNTSVLLGNTITTINNVTLANVTISSGTASNISLTSPLSVSSGGTGSANLTVNNVLIGNGTSAVTSVAPGTTGNVLTSIGGAWVSNVALTSVAAGSNTQVQYNNAGALGASANFVFDGANLGLGVTPSAWGTGWKAFQAGAYGQGYAAHPSLPISYLTSNAYYNGSNWIYSTSSYANYFAVSAQNGQFQWLNAPSGTAGNAITFTQAMTLDASGNLLVGQTSANSFNLTSGFGFDVRNTFGLGVAVQSNPCAIFNRNTSTGTIVDLRYNGTTVGSISYNGTITSYNATSDYRLKNIDGPVTGAKDFIMALQPKQGTWKSDGSKFVGFLAHEFQEISPSSVNGVKDAVDADGKPIMQSMQASSAEVMANLITFVQEQQVLIQSLTDRIAQLDAK
jgi:hypothetical protein